MNRLQIGLSIFILVFLNTAMVSGGEIYSKPGFIPDGDTIFLKSGEKIRYIGVDTPEMNHKKGKPQLFAREAREFNKSITKGKRLRILLGNKKKDRFNRYLGYVYLPDGRMVNELILKKGMGWFYYHRDNSKFNSKLMKSQKKAMRSKIGIWSYLSKVSKPVIPNKRSMRFHSIDCKKIRKKRKSITIIQAFEKGYSPSRKCIENIFKYGF